jgi:hypothetical protein
MTKLKIAISLLAAALSACAQGNNSPNIGKALTPDQVAVVHGKLFHGGPPGQIQEQLANSKGDVYLRTGTVIDEVSVEVPFETKLAGLTCDSDAVILAKATSGSSHPTTDQGYIYTDWQFAVEQILKNNPKAPINSGGSIVVTRPGGVLEIGGRKVYAQPKQFRDFALGEELLLYVRFVPQTGAYALHEPNYFRASAETLKAAHEGINASTKICGGAN